MSGTSTGQTAPPGVPSGSLVSLLGEQRAEIVLELRRVGEATVAQLAAHLGISEVATRRHLGVLEDDGLVVAERVVQGRGRPASRYQLTAAADQLFPQRYDRFAADVLEFLADEHGRSGVRDFLRWRLRREVAGLGEVVTAQQLHERLDQLAAALSERGFAASVQPSIGGFTLVQDHCAIGDVAREHPAVCSYEAATFSEVLGSDVQVARRATLAGGASACVCDVTARHAPDQHQAIQHQTDSAPRGSAPTAVVDPAASTPAGDPT